MIGTSDDSPDKSGPVCLMSDSRTTGKLVQCDDPENTVALWWLADTPAFWTITTFAGRPPPVNGGPASQAQLGRPYGVAVDGPGNLYIADTRNHCVRKVDSTGTITTIAGSGERGFGGDGGQATAAQLYSPLDVAVDGEGNLYVADSLNRRIRKLTPPTTGQDR